MPNDKRTRDIIAQRLLTLAWSIFLVNGIQEVGAPYSSLEVGLSGGKLEVRVG